MEGAKLQNPPPTAFCTDDREIVPGFFFGQEILFDDDSVRLDVILGADWPLRARLFSVPKVLSPSMLVSLTWSVPIELARGLLFIGLSGASVESISTESALSNKVMPFAACSASWPTPVSPV